MSAKITVTIQPQKYPSEYDFTKTVNLSEELIQNCFRVLDVPSENLDHLTAELCCTSRATIEAVMKERKEVAEIISQTLTEIILDGMGFRDTIDGYVRE